MVYMVGLSVPTVARDGNCVFRSHSVLLEDEGQCNKSMQKAVHWFYVTSEGQGIQSPTTIVGQVESKRSTISLLSILDHHYHPLKFKGGLLVDVSGILYNINCVAQIGSMDIQDRATAQAVSLQPLTAESRVHARFKPCGIWTKWHCDRFFSEFFGFSLSVSFRRRSQ
jgi:hypothetical protein